MEQYHNEHEVSEKSIYLVHLDNTRIVILVSLLLCIITVSFLIGTKFNTGTSDTPFSDVNSAKASIPSEFDTTTDNEDLDKLLNEGSDSELGKSIDPDLTNLDSKSNLPDKSEDTVPVKVEKQAESKPAQETKSTKPVAKKSTPKKEVVAVSAQSPKKPKPVATKSGYSIQIASFDTYSKAAEASANVNQLSYQSYVDKALVKGKYYYRVKIGPMKSKQDAFAVMNNLQQYPKYSSSYIVFEK